MIDKIQNAAAASYIVRGTTLNNISSSPVPGTNGARVIEDKVDLSPKAVETIESQKEARKEEQDKLIEKILSKGFVKWTQEEHRKKIEEQVRAEVLQSMGLDEDSYKNLEAEVQQRIEEIIQQKIREKLEEEMRKDKANYGGDYGVAFLSR